MKYYSEKLKKLFNTDKELIQAEEDLQKKTEEREAKITLLKEQRAERAKEVEEAFKAYKTAQDQAYEKLNVFLKDYGTYHTTLRYEPFNSIKSLVSPFGDSIFNFLTRSIFD